MIYVASPYTHPDPAVRHERAVMAEDYRAKAFAAGLPVFSPIAATLNAIAPGPVEYEHYAHINDALIAVADEMHVLCMIGGKESRGVIHELEVAATHGVRIRFFGRIGGEWIELEEGDE